jgi:hypothetical protein
MIMTALPNGIDLAMLRLAHQHVNNNKTALNASGGGACFYCISHFSAADVVDWCDRGATALCPKCGIDSVIASNAGYVLDDAFLQAMRNFWFENSEPVTDTRNNNA